MHSLRKSSLALPLTLCVASACVPVGGAGTQLGGANAVFVDGGFDDAGRPIDGGVIVAPRDAGPTPSDGGPTPGDGGPTQGPPDAAVVNVVYDECPDNAHTLDVPIVVNDEGNTVARDPGVTRFLVPIAETERLFSLNSLVVRDDQGARLPAQFEVLSRWGGGKADCAAPIRYAYAIVNAVPEVGGQANWKVASVSDNAGESTTLSLTESADAWIIDTGLARFTIRRQGFQGLSRVEVADGQGGYRLVSELAADESGFVVDHGGPKTVRARDPWYLALERRGPQVVTVAARGFYAASASERDLAYAIRMHFYAGSGRVRIEHTYYYGEVAGWSILDISNRTKIDGAIMRVPLVAATDVLVRADQQVHMLAAGEDVQIEQRKRLPNQAAVRFAVRSGGSAIENGQWADRPLLAVSGGGVHVAATLARLSIREPQGLAWNAAENQLEVQMTSSPIFIGGARGIWTVAALDFGPGAAVVQDSLQLHAERRLLGVPSSGYLNTTRTIGPYAAQSGPVVQAYATAVKDIHDRTVTYLRDLRVTGVQVWPDLPRTSCEADFNCDQARNELYEGGDNNYWNWSKPGMDEFFRTGNNSFLYDFSLGEATTYIETLAVRTDYDRVDDSSVTGLAVCYGGTRGYTGDFQEGLNNRRDSCVASYSYDKMIKLAFLATGDGRFVDFFESAAESSVNAFGAPPNRPDPYLEVDLSRLSEERFEVLSDGAEFARDPVKGQMLRSKLTEYVDHMLGKTLIDGHHCTLTGTGYNDTRDTGRCDSAQAWMMPVGTEWAMRTSRFLGHSGLHQWVIDHGRQSANNHTTLSNGLPDFSDSASGWRTVYGCDANQSGVNDSSCRKYTDGENGYRFYPNGLLAFLNVFGLVLAADPSDPNRICEWLPAAYPAQINALSDNDLNGRIWGKASGQAFGMAGEAVGALSMCP